MKLDGSDRVKYFSFLIFIICNIFSDYKILKSKKGKIVYYKCYSRDLYRIKLFIRFISIVVLIFLSIFPNMNLFRFNIHNDVKEIAELFSLYLLLLFIIIIITIIVYSLKYSSIEYYYVTNNKEIPDKYVFAKHILNKYNLSLYSSNREYIISSSSGNKFRYEYNHQKGYNYLIRILTLLMYFVFFLSGPSIFINVIIENDYLRNTIILIAIIQVVILTWIHLIIIKYKKVIFTLFE